MLLCLVHGAWHDEACWQPLMAELGRRGHECVVPALPLDEDRASFDDYAEVVAECLRDRELPVLVGNSMSSAVIPLVAVRRPVRLLVYLCPAMGGLPAPTGRRTIVTRTDTVRVAAVQDCPVLLDREDARIRLSSTRNGAILAGPLVRERGILMADLDLDSIAARKRCFDATGHYNRPDIFHPTVDDRAKPSLTIEPLPPDS